MESYLSDRLQHLIINGARSDKFGLATGFPKGRGVGPYSKNRESILYQIVDENQLYRSFATASLEAYIAQPALKERTTIIEQWMFANTLKLNIEQSS